MDFEFVRALGVLVAEVPGMDTDAKYLHDHGILLINPNLDPAGRAEISDQVLGYVTVCQQAS